MINQLVLRNYKRFNEQAKRNIDRLSYDFMFQLTADEKSEVVANCDHLACLKFSDTTPYIIISEFNSVIAAETNTRKNKLAPSEKTQRKAAAQTATTATQNTITTEISKPVNRMNSKT